MLSKMILRRQKSASEVEAAILRHGPNAASAAGSVLGPYLEEGEALPDLELLQRLFGRALNDHHTRIVASDEARLAGARRTAGLRNRRDASAKQVGDKLLLMRDVFTSLFGAKATAGLLSIKTPFDRDPVALARLSRRAVKFLRSDHAGLPPSRAPAVSIDRHHWADELELPLKELETALWQERWERRGADAALVAKHEALEAYDGLFLRVARLQEALFRFAGLTSLADRVRPSGRRPGLTHREVVSKRQTPPPESETRPLEPISSNPVASNPVASNLVAMRSRS